MKKLAPILYLPHGGGPMPVLYEESHKQMVDFLEDIAAKLPKPEAIIVISAHWEESIATITSSPKPELIYDYYGFPEESYMLRYDVPGDKNMANEVAKLFKSHNLSSNLDTKRGFDHGMFIPLMLMYPKANIPTIQISLLKTLDPDSHIRLGKALQELREKNILVVGSGMSYHNMRGFFAKKSMPDRANDTFHDWLISSVTDPKLSIKEKESRLIGLENAPYFRYTHPREEHLLPLHVCFGMGIQSEAKVVFDDYVLGKRVCSFLWG